MRCPACNKGELKPSLKEEHMFGISLGQFNVESCSECGESFSDEETTKAIEEAAKEKGVWGLGREAKIIKVGNSLAVRIPKKIIEHLGLSEGKKTYMHPEGNKLILES